MLGAYALIPAAGAGDRAQQGGNKVLAPIGGTPVLARTIARLLQAPSISGIAVIARRQDWEAVERLIAGLESPYPVGLVEGGAMRLTSVQNGLAAVPEDADTIVVHDAARPFVSVRVLEESIALARRNGSAVAAVPVIDTIKHARVDLSVVATLDRGVLHAIQTPQTFRADLIRAAYGAVNECDVSLTDDASVVERFGAPVFLFRSDYENIKLTTPFDFRIAEVILAHGPDAGTCCG